MKISRFIAFITLLLLQIALCVIFFFIYSNGIEKTYIEKLREYSKELSNSFKSERFFIEAVDDREMLDILNRRMIWMQENYRINNGLLLHIYRNNVTNEIIFSNSKSEDFDDILVEYIRQWKESVYSESDFAIFKIGSYYLISTITEIDDDVRTVGKLELVFNYNSVKLEIDKLRNTLIWFSAGISMCLFVVFLLITILSRPKRRTEQVTSIQSSKELKREETSNNPIELESDEKVLYDNKNQPHKIKTLHLENKPNNILRKEEYENKIQDEEIIINTKSKKNQDDTDFLRDTKEKKRNYVHKVVL